jgi:hypothetical protein
MGLMVLRIPVILSILRQRLQRFIFKDTYMQLRDGQGHADWHVSTTLPP